MGSWVRYSWDLAGLTGADQQPPSGFHVAVAAPRDEAGVLEVVLEAYGSDPVWAAMLPAIERRMRARVAETLGRPSCEYIALTQQDRAVAVSGIAREHWTDQNLLTGVCVRPEFQRRGLGTFLLRYSLERLRRMGLATARVYTESGSLADRKIYPLFGGRREEGVVYPGAAVGGERRTQGAQDSGGWEEKPRMKHNVYFGGRVQSLGFDGPGGAASVGVIRPGTYSFTTTGAEQVIVLTGSLAVRLPGEDWRSVHAPGAYVVPPATTFEVSADTDVSYLCRFSASADRPPVVRGGA